MLEHTFIHLPGYGINREKKLWEEGTKTWDDFLDRFGKSDLHTDYCRTVAKSKYALKQKQGDYFADTLLSRETWRAFPHFNKIAYLDIETTGLSAERNEVTVIGLYDGKKVYSYIQGDNLNEFKDEMEKYEMVVSFNGTVFDVPFLRANMPGIDIPRLHIDLRFILSSMNIGGGLKKIEEQFGFEREDDLKGLNGYDAVKLWRKYRKNNDKDALDKLVRYNAADISNLKKLIEWAYKEKREISEIDRLA